MRDVTYWQAWALWWEGEPTDQLRMWGQPMVVWARLGKALQILGALTVVIDIIGPERLKKFGKRLSSDTNVVRRARRRLQPFRQDAAEVLTSGLGCLVLPIMLSWPLVTGALSIADTLGLASLDWDFWPWGAAATLGPIALLLGAAVLYALPIAGLRLVELAAGGFDRLIMQPVARQLDKTVVDVWAKIVGLALLLVGSHFDLLAT